VRKRPLVEIPVLVLPTDQELFKVIRKFIFEETQEFMWGIWRRVMESPPPEDKKYAPPDQEGAQEVSLDLQYATEAQALKQTIKVCLMGPPVSRRAQRRLGITKFIPGIGYQKRSCSRCGKHAWLGPNQLKQLEAASETEVVCRTCIQPELEAGTVAMTHLGGRGGGYHFQNGRYLGPPEEFQN
jgi:hypothetical protein